MKRFLILIGVVLTILAAQADIAPQPSAYYELRIYDVTSNKLDAVVERFHDTVEPVRQKYGISTLGYWLVGTTNGDKFVYLMTAPSKEALKEKEKEFGADPKFKEGYAASNRKHGKTVDKIAALPMAAGPGAQYDLSAAKTPRVFDLRIYSVLPGKLDPFRNRWRDQAVPIYERHGLHSVGWWIAEQKDPDGNDRFICLLAGESADAIQKSIAAFHKDPEWQQVEKESERDGKLRSKVEAFKLTPAGFSGLK
ncbi:MAG: family containing protein [Verrucomicrobiales bacterium]|nr:family containing protein [Verrucomicrobiales bacterium]